MIQFKNKRQTEIYWLSDATFYDPINTKYQFIKPFLEKNVYKISVCIEEYEAFKDIQPKHNFDIDHNCQIFIKLAHFQPPPRCHY